MEAAQTSPDLDKLVQMTGDLPAMPHVASLVIKKISDPDADANDIQKLIAQDPSLAARVLKLANSSFYARSRSIATLRDAVVIIGMKTVRSLVIASVTRDLFDPFGLTEKLLWEHSVGCALAARTIAVRLRYSRVDESFLSGLLHDVGKMILFTRFPDQMRLIIQEVYSDPSLSFAKLEREVFGFDHAQVGRLLARKWQFPEEIDEAIGCHHNPARAKILPALAVIVHLANAFCHKLELGPTKRPELEMAGVASARALKLSEAKLIALQEEILQTFQAEAGTMS
ncbi:HDIG domain-containing protein [Desulfacinum hydrothermale DSM 13146]|uniref:HDIG domain-containing protein n=1 Tax=Desulfacinum hydrothermale DSM 13146 TaxID=1121390 RepID=A0A1W1WYE2_9BACT|nr:HDOD domain-containing protein [Desulfacinum hydrothermale]SMC16448.1 HDIG domain-containing protein [Desulfacinum hydrothermale DSM 13146]